MTLIRNSYSKSDTVVSNRLTRFIPLPYLRAVYGFVLALGAPLGWILVQWTAGRNPFDDQHYDSLVYMYMGFSTAIVFSLLGYFIGRRESVITELALTDALTALNNKRYFKNRLEQEFSRFKRYGRPLCLIQIDLDHFKTVNDTWGHQAGDEVLKTISTVILANCRKNEVAARVGGEEVAIIAADCQLEAAVQLAERLREVIETQTITWQGNLIQVTASFGVVQANEQTENAWALYQAADKALYQAKQNGRNRVETNYEASNELATES